MELFLWNNFFIELDFFLVIQQSFVYMDQANSATVI